MISWLDQSSPWLENIYEGKHCSPPLIQSWIGLTIGLAAESDGVC